MSAADETSAERRRTRMQALGRIGGQATAAKYTDAEQSARLKAVRAARTKKDDARRAAEGLPPRTPTPKPLSDEALRYWLDRVDERFPDRVFENRMQKRRLAVRLAREAAARSAAAAFENGGRA